MDLDVEMADSADCGSPPAQSWNQLGDHLQVVDVTTLTEQYASLSLVANASQTGGTVETQPVNASSNSRENGKHLAGSSNMGKYVRKDRAGGPMRSSSRQLRKIEPYPGKKLPKVTREFCELGKSVRELRSELQEAQNRRRYYQVQVATASAALEKCAESPGSSSNYLEHELVMETAILFEEKARDDLERLRKELESAGVGYIELTIDIDEPPPKVPLPHHPSRKEQSYRDALKVFDQLNLKDSPEPYTQSGGW